MKNFNIQSCRTTVLFWCFVMVIFGNKLTAQPSGREVVISGARFSNRIFETWIEEYQRIYPKPSSALRIKGHQNFPMLI